MGIYKEWQNKYNSFNSLKALKHIDYWKSISQEKIPPPIFVSIDPMNLCNFNCPHCNAKRIIKNSKMGKDTMDNILIALKAWKTKSCCIGGGGESLLNDNSHYLIDILSKNDIEIGVVTNGSRLDQYVEDAKNCRWVGISIDSSNSKTFSKMKGVNENIFDSVINNVQLLASKNYTEVTYKFLVHPNNYDEIYEASKLAKEIGCNLIHIRPGSNPWFEDINYKFNSDMITEALHQINRARINLEDDNFKVYGVIHKFDDDWSCKKSFNKCWAMYVTCFISPDGTIGLCCDRRGDKNIEMCNIRDYSEWGSEHHINLANSVNIKTCPRCTYTYLNEIFENVIIDDKMLCNFI